MLEVAKCLSNAHLQVAGVASTERRLGSNPGATETTLKTTLSKLEVHADDAGTFSPLPTTMYWVAIGFTSVRRATILTIQ